jgi:hypothetical protein
MIFGQPILIGASCCLLAKPAAVQDSDHFGFGTRSIFMEVTPNGWKNLIAN